MNVFKFQLIDSMIRTKDDLKYYLDEDLKRYGGKKPNLKDWIVKNEGAYI